MRLHQVRLQNVLSFVDASFTCDHYVTTLVGPNDAGKSNILRIIDHLLGDTPRLSFRDIRRQYSKDPVVIDLSFIGQDKDRDVLAPLLPDLQLPPAPFRLDLSCREGTSASVPEGDPSISYSRTGRSS